MSIDINTIVLVLVGLLNLYTAYISRRTEKNTNSMKDALVASTADESYARGVKSGEASSMNLNHRKPDNYQGPG